MTRSTVQQMVFSYPCNIRYHCLLQCRRQNDKKTTAKNSEHSQNSWQNVRRTEYSEKSMREQTRAVTPTQGEPCEFREHSRKSPDPDGEYSTIYIFKQRQNRRSMRELNQTTPSAPQTPRIQVNQEEANLITFTPIVEQQVPPVQGATGIQEQPKRQRSPQKKKNSEWTLNERQFDHSKTQEISHILPGEHLNVFNGEEPSVSYLRLPVKRERRKPFLYQMW